MGLENYSRIRKLGKGSFGEVFLVHDRRNNHQYVMKEVDLAQFGPKGRKEALKEVAFLNAMHHPYIVAYREFFEQENSAIGRKMLYIVMEFADGGDLDARIKSQNGRYFPESVILEWFVQICLAVKHIHDRKIIHRDLKSENCFLATEKSEKGKKYTIKVGDFGISKSMAHTAAQAMTRIGTPYYLSPEICMNKPYNMKSDIWSMGVILYELMSLKHPFDATSMEGLLNKIVKSQPAPLPKTYSIELRTVVDSMLSKQPSKRPTVNSLLKLPFLAPYVQKLLSPAQLADEFSHTVIHSDASARPIHNHAPPMPNPNHIAQKPNFNGVRAKQAQQAQQQQPLPPPSAHHHQHPPPSSDGYYEQKESVRGSPTPSALRPPSSGHRQPPQSDRTEFPSLYPAPQHAAAPTSYANMSNADKIRAIREKRESELRELKQRQVEEHQLASRRRHEEKSNEDERERAMRLREQAKERQMAEARYQQDSAMPAAIRAPRGIPSVTRARDDGMGAAPLHGVPYQDRNPSNPPATRLQHQQLAEAARKQREDEITRMRINYFKERKLKRETKLRELDPYQQQPSAAPSSYGRAVAAPPIHPSYLPRQQQSNQYVSRPHSQERQSYAPLPQPTFVPQRRPLLQQPSIHPSHQARNDAAPPRWR